MSQDIALPGSHFPLRLIEIDDVVGVGIDARGVLDALGEVCPMALQEGIKVALGSPVAESMTRVPSVLLCKAVPR